MRYLRLLLVVLVITIGTIVSHVDHYSVFAASQQSPPNLPPTPAQPEDPAPDPPLPQPQQPAPVEPELGENFESGDTPGSNIPSPEEKTFSAYVPPDVSSLNKLGTTDIQILIGRVIQAVMGIMGSIALVMFIYGGLLWMISRGESDKAEKGQQILVWSSLGVVVIFASYALVKLVFEVFS